VNLYMVFGTAVCNYLNYSLACSGHHGAAIIYDKLYISVALHVCWITHFLNHWFTLYVVSAEPCFYVQWKWFTFEPTFNMRVASLYNVNNAK